MKNRFTYLAIATICTLLFPKYLHPQCMMVPLPLEQRVAEASAIALAKPLLAHTYLDDDGNIYTLWRMEVRAWLKGARLDEQIALLTYGGVHGDQAMVVYPSLKVRKENEYIVFLKGEETDRDDKALRQLEPNLLQSFAYGDAQGVLTYQFGTYRDAYFPERLSEEEIFHRIYTLTGQTALTPEGVPYTPRPLDASETGNRQFPITSFSPNPTNSGTIVSSDFLQIDGSGFGSSPGDVWFPNADDGGATLVATSFNSDYVSWSDTHIEVKVLEEGGTGTFEVNSISSPSALTINYSHISIYSSFLNFPEVTRQRYYLRNMNGSGGYTFSYNSTANGGFSNNSAAVAAFERAMETWRCNTFVNWIPGGTTTAGVANDNINVVTWDGTLPSGTLGVTTSRFAGAGTSSCQQHNTVWCLEEVDMAFNPTINWEFGPPLPASNEYDFESVCLHELGHAHGLGHRIASGELMHYAIANGVAIRTPATQEINGANAKMAYSTIPTCFNPSSCGSGPMVALNSSNCALPIELLSFVATPQGRMVLLEWQTASETNNAAFTIERAGHSLQFQELATVPGAGNSTEKRAYQWTDENPLPGENYYRLRQTDFDGQFSFGPTVVVEMPSHDLTVLPYPNPASDVVILFVDVPSEKNGRMEVEIADLFGRSVLQRTFEPVEGVNHFPINIKGLAKGIYLLSVHTSSGHFTARLSIH